MARSQIDAFFVQSLLVETALPFYKQELFWIACGAIASGMAALATAVLAVFTYRLARDTKALALESNEAIKAEDRRHVDSLQPHIAIFVEQDNAGMSVMLANIGPGYAKEISLSGTLAQNQPIRVLNVPPSLASNQRCRYIVILSGPPHVIWTGFTVRYKDAFGNTFETTTGDSSLTFTLGSTYEYRQLNQ